MNPKVVTWKQGAAFHPCLASQIFRKKDNIDLDLSLNKPKLATEDKAKQSNYNDKATKPKLQLGIKLQA